LIAICKAPAPVRLRPHRVGDEVYLRLRVQLVSDVATCEIATLLVARLT
jgi:hypothetical protein